MVEKRLEEQIERALDARPASIEPLSGGCIGSVFLVSMPDGEKLVAKLDETAKPRLDIEGYMLDYLAQHSRLPVPAVVVSKPRLLVMAYVAGESTFSRAAEEHAAELLAQLHDVTAPRYGLEKDTLIGGLHQPNSPEDDWVAFFRDLRLRHMANAACKAGRLPTQMRDRLERLAGKLDTWLRPPKAPSLLHGDVWTTNALSINGRITAFIDPAIYFGHPEIELAFIKLFDTFGRSFFSHYAALRGLEPGFYEERKDLYNLYPLLVHVRLFGGSYVVAVDRILRRFGF